MVVDFIGRVLRPQSPADTTVDRCTNGLFEAVAQLSGQILFQKRREMPARWPFRGAEAPVPFHDVWIVERAPSAADRAHRGKEEMFSGGREHYY